MPKAERVKTMKIAAILATIATLMAICFPAASLAQVKPFRPGGISQPCVTTTATADDGSTVSVCAPIYYPAGSSATNPSGNPATIYSGVQTCTTGAVALPSRDLVNGIVIQASSGNTGVVDIGTATVTTATGYDLAGGQAISYGVANLSAVNIICANATDTISFTGN